MPCYTLVQVEVKNKEMAEKALKAMGQKGTITKNPNGTYMVTPEKQTAEFRDSFLQEYAAQVAMAKAKASGYAVARKVENGETVLYLRQY